MSPRGVALRVERVLARRRSPRARAGSRTSDGAAAAACPTSSPGAYVNAGNRYPGRWQTEPCRQVAMNGRVEPRSGRAGGRRAGRRRSTGGAHGRSRRAAGRCRGCAPRSFAAGLATVLARPRLADRHDRRGAPLLGAHAPAPPARRPRRAPPRARPRRPAAAAAPRAARSSTGCACSPTRSSRCRSGPRTSASGTPRASSTPRSATTRCTRSSTGSSSPAGRCSGRRCSSRCRGRPGSRRRGSSPTCSCMWLVMLVLSQVFIWSGHVYYEPYLHDPRTLGAEPARRPEGGRRRDAGRERADDARALVWLLFRSSARARRASGCSTPAPSRARPRARRATGGPTSRARTRRARRAASSCPASEARARTPPAPSPRAARSRSPPRRAPRPGSRASGRRPARGARPRPPRRRARGRGATRSPSPIRFTSRSCSSTSPASAGLSSGSACTWSSESTLRRVRTCSSVSSWWRSNPYFRSVDQACSSSCGSTSSASCSSIQSIWRRRAARSSRGSAIGSATLPSCPRPPALHSGHRGTDAGGAGEEERLGFRACGRSA